MRRMPSALCALSLWAATMPPAAPAAPETVTVVMVDNRFVPDHLVLHAHRPAVLRLVNRGRDMHEFTAPAFLKSAEVKNPRLLSNNGGDIVVQPGRTVAVLLTPTRPGSFDLTCADHDWDGMTGRIDVR